MNKFKRFCRIFTQEEVPNVIKIGRRYYQAEASLLGLKEKITSRDVFSIGLPLGEMKQEFQPTPALLEILAKSSTKKVFITAKGAWLFLCKRDIFDENVVKTNVREGPVLVQNEQDENLGFGEIVKKRGKKMLKILLDRGDYLRREK